MKRSAALAAFFKQGKGATDQGEAPKVVDMKTEDTKAPPQPRKNRKQRLAEAFTKFKK